MQRTLTVAILLVGLATVSVPAMGQTSFKVANRVKLGGEGGWDYLTYDADGQRLFITRGSHVMVVDAKTLKVSGDIPDLSGIHGVALAPEMNRGFISNGGDNTVTVFDLKTLKKLDSIMVGERPDAILYDPFSKSVFTFNARSHDATVIGWGSNKLVSATTGPLAGAGGGERPLEGTIPLGGKPETPASDGKGKLYVNIEDKGQIAEVDVTKQVVLNTWPIAPCEEPSALAFDVEHHRLFAGCGNKMMAVVDSDSGKVVTTVPIGEGVDAGAFNPKTQEVFMSCGEGVLTVIHEDTPDKYTVKQNLATAKGARTMALDRDNNVVYLVTAQREDKPVPPGQRPTMVPGSFELIVVRPE
jgi:YVTN family beta-propeller protein